jgi:hypothetical protein
MEMHKGLDSLQRLLENTDVIPVVSGCVKQANIPAEHKT